MLRLQNLGKMQTQVAAQGYMTLHEPAIQCRFRMHTPQLLDLAPALRQRQSMLGAQGSATSCLSKGLMAAAMRHSDDLQ